MIRNKMPLCALVLLAVICTQPYTSAATYPANDAAFEIIDVVYRGHSNRTLLIGPSPVLTESLLRLIALEPARSWFFDPITSAELTDALETIITANLAYVDDATRQKARAALNHLIHLAAYSVNFDPSPSQRAAALTFVGNFYSTPLPALIRSLYFTAGTTGTDLSPEVRTQGILLLAKFPQALFSRLSLQQKQDNIVHYLGRIKPALRILIRTLYLQGNAGKEALKNVAVDILKFAVSPAYTPAEHYLRQRALDSLIDSISLLSLDIRMVLFPIASEGLNTRQSPAGRDRHNPQYLRNPALLQLLHALANGPVCAAKLVKP